MPAQGEHHSCPLRTMHQMMVEEVVVVLSEVEGWVTVFLFKNVCTQKSNVD